MKFRLLVKYGVICALLIFICIGGASGASRPDIGFRG